MKIALAISQIIESKFKEELICEKEPDPEEFSDGMIDGQVVLKKAKKYVKGEELLNQLKNQKIEVK